MTLSKGINLKPLKEDQIQIALVQFLNMHPHILFCHVANEGDFPVQYRVKLKRMGLYKGWFDITIILPKLCFIELKTKKGRLSEAQKDFKKKLDENNIPNTVAHSVEEAIDFLKQIDVLRK